MKKGIVALALGTFGLGMTEYVMMSILPDLSHDFNVSIAEAGHLISAYAIGVCIGAPLVAVFLRNWRLKHILMLLMVFYVIGNLLFASGSTFMTGIVGRFISGLPHGAFFGAGSIVASRLMPDKQTTAVALMTLGMTIANLVGIPIGSYVANTFNWRWIFYFDAVWGVVTFCSIWWLIKDMGALPKTTIKGEFKFLKRMAPWLLIIATVLCQGGAFAMYSYVSPIMSEAGLAMKYMPVMMIIVGAGMCLGNYYSGVVSDRISPEKTTLIVAIVMTAALILTSVDTFSIWTAGTTVVVGATMLFALSSPMQLMLIEYSPGGELMGGAMVQVAFNLGNALGAYFGGLPISAGFRPEASSVVGAVMTAMSIIVILYFIHRYPAKSTDDNRINPK
ncbi:MAG: MFS transporter [Muribaculaceae bacterium]|nr:MFS transporter [Muribaculaceae bacterium]